MIFPWTNLANTRQNHGDFSSLNKQSCLYDCVNVVRYWRKLWLFSRVSNLFAFRQSLSNPAHIRLSFQIFVMFILWILPNSIWVVSQNVQILLKLILPDSTPPIHHVCLNFPLFAFSNNFLFSNMISPWIAFDHLLVWTLWALSGWSGVQSNPQTYGPNSAPLCHRPHYGASLLTEESF